MRGLLFAAIIGVVVVVVWSRLDATPPKIPHEVPAKAPSTSAHHVAERQSPAAPLAPRPVFTADAAIDGDVDDEPFNGAVERASNEEIEKTLSLNAAFAEANVGHYCELAERLGHEPLFKTLQGSRDATKETSRLFGITEDDRRVTLSHEVRRMLMAGEDLAVTPEQLDRIDFSWMRSLRDYDRLSGELGGPMPWGTHVYSPASKFPYYFVRLRVLRAANRGDWDDSVKDIEALATLMHSTSSPDDDVEGAKMLELELQTIEKLRAGGAKVPQGLSLPKPQQVKLHAALVNDAFRFVAPGVSPEAQQKAFDCARLAGLGCAMATEAMSTANDLRRIIDTEPQPFDRSACNSYRFKVRAKTVGYYGASGQNARLRQPSALFGPLEERSRGPASHSGLGCASHQEVLPYAIARAVKVLLNERLILAPKLGELGRLSAALDEALHRASELLTLIAVVGRAERRVPHRRAIEAEIFDSRPEPLANHRWVSPHDRRRHDLRRRPNVPRGDLKHAPGKELAWPGRKCNHPTRLEHPEHLRDGDLGPRRKHVPELAQHHVERRPVVRERLSIALSPFDLDARERTVFFRRNEELGRQVEAADLRSGPRRSHGDHASTAPHIEHPLTRLDTREPHQLRRGSHRRHLEWSEKGPALALSGLELCERCIHLVPPLKKHHLLVSRQAGAMKFALRPKATARPTRR